MAATRGRTVPGLSETLFADPHGFDFFQAVRILERLARASARLGQDQPDQEAVRFRSQPSLSFPPSAIAAVRPLTHDTPAKLLPLAELIVTFMGVTGPSGVMPYHYTALLLRRMRDKDFSLRDFLDLFHHRAISFFYRAWTKYRLPIVYERTQDESAGAEDRITWGLYCLVGMGTAGLRRRLGVDDEALLFFGGHFAHFPRSAVVLEAVLGDYFGLPIQVLQMQGQWLQLPPGEVAVMPCPAQPAGLNHQIGVSLVVGDRVWDVQSKFRVRIGPLTYAQFQRFLPGGDALKPLCQLTRTYVGPELDFDIQLILAADEVPAALVGRRQAALGWNTWMRTRRFSRPADDAVFRIDAD
jgi:type VI secretion system protein ImpH